MLIAVTLRFKDGCRVIWAGLSNTDTEDAWDNRDRVPEVCESKLLTLWSKARCRRSALLPYITVVDISEKERFKDSYIHGAVLNYPNNTRLSRDISLLKDNLEGTAITEI
jgi:hypothetical protein